MKVKPQNRHLLVELLCQEEEEQTSTILVPDDYSVTDRTQHQLVRILATSNDSCYELGQSAIVEGHMIKDVSIQGHGVVQLVMENYVLALVEDATT